MTQTTWRELVAVGREFQVDPIQFAECGGWLFSTGAFRHESGGFFSVIGVEAPLTNEQMLILAQPQQPVAGLLTWGAAAGAEFLVQARAEPGAAGATQVGPTIQASPAAFSRGSGTPYLQRFSEASAGGQVIVDSLQLDFGGRYLGKSKRTTIVSLDEEPLVEEGFAILGHDELVDACGHSSVLTTDLRSLLSQSPWGEHESKLRPRSEAVRRGLLNEVRSDRLGAVFAKLHAATNATGRPIELSQLTDWEITDTEISSTSARYSVRPFQIALAGREVGSWCQPLICPETDGLVVLMVRSASSGPEVLVRATSEVGVERTLMPSIAAYPGDEPVEALSAMRSLIEVFEIDEGGRFNGALTKYILATPGATASHESHEGVWLNMAEVKFLMATSNICSTQLRVAVSLLLAVEL